MSMPVKLRRALEKYNAYATKVINYTKASGPLSEKEPGAAIEHITRCYCQGVPAIDAAKALRMLMDIWGAPQEA